MMIFIVLIKEVKNVMIILMKMLTDIIVRMVIIFIND